MVSRLYPPLVPCILLTDMETLPSGTVTFLFTDIEGSTRLAQEHPNGMPALLERHHEILNQSIRAQKGYVFQIIGDAFCAAFHSANDALNSAIEAQKTLQNEAWNPAPVKVRMGIHTGTANLTEENQYSGYSTLALTQRITSAGHGGQILVSGATRELVRDALHPKTELFDLGNKRLKDLLRPEHLYQLNISGLSTTFPPLKTLDSFPNNLPAQLTTFIGRENEIREIKQELDERRLVTLTGSGGTGKTRLSLQVAAELIEEFDHGVWFVELAPLTDPDLIPQTILSAIGIVEQQGKGPLDVLKDYLQEKQALIVLDNCEHLVSASAQVVNTLLRAAPQVKILTSSREALGVRGEVSYPVPSLSLPDIKRLPVIEQLSQYEAVRLFIDRASLVAPQFDVDKENAPSIAQICYRLDGIPLAIELAAARVKVLSVDQISRRLDDRFRLLTGGARTALPRQQTLRALIDWSFDLLSDKEQLLLLRLSVFAGGWTLEAAEEICQGDEIDTYDILDLLTQLVNKSLVVVTEKSLRSEARYRMLETIRQYAREKLLESGKGEDIRDLHFEYYFQMVKQAEPEFFTAKELVWLVWLKSEWDNLRAAVEWSLEREPGAGLEMVTNIGYFLLDHNSFWSDLDNWFSQLLSHPENAERAPLRAKGLLQWAWCNAVDRGDPLSVQSIIKEALSIYGDLGDQNGMAHSFHLQGALSIWKGNHQVGYSLLEKSHNIFREAKDRHWLAHVLLFLGQSLALDEYARKLSCLEESLSLYRELGYISGVMEALKQLGAMELRLGHFEVAHVWLDEAVLIMQKNAASLQDSRTVSYDLGDLAYYEGNYELAQRYYEECLSWSTQIGVQDSIRWAKVRLGYIFLQRDNRREPRLLFREALLSFQSGGIQSGICFTLDGLASLAVIERKWEKALVLFAFVTEQREDIHGQRAPVEQDSVDKDLAVIQSQLTEEEVVASTEKGRTMTLEQAIALALEE